MGETGKTGYIFDTRLWLYTRRVTGIFPTDHDIKEFKPVRRRIPVEGGYGYLSYFSDKF